MNADCWRLPGGEIGTEVARCGDQVKVLVPPEDETWPRPEWIELHLLRPEPARYYGARGGRA